MSLGSFSSFVAQHADIAIAALGGFLAGALFGVLSRWIVAGFTIMAIVAVVLGTSSTKRSFEPWTKEVHGIWQDAVQFRAPDTPSSPGRRRK